MEYNKYQDEWKDIFETESSDRAFEEEVMLAGFEEAGVKSEGGGVSYASGQEVWTARYQHETIALAFALTEEAIEDSLYDKLSSRYTKALARSMSHTKNTKGAAILNNAFTSGTYGDGSYLCASHTLLNGSTISNQPSTAADLNETALENAVIDIAKFTDERGLKIAINAKSLCIPTDLQFVAERVLNSTGRVSTSDNDLNALNSTSAVPGGYKVNHFLTDADAWFLLTDAPNGLKHMNRVSIKTGMEGDFETGNVRFKARERYSFGVSDWRGIYGSAGA
jgi:hypothetical protein